jgi:AcrR family transcriptional regulator
VPSLHPTRARILEAALTLFASRGYDATSVREICEAAGITKPTLYHFFGSKAGVFSAVLAGAFEETRRLLDTAFSGATPFAEAARQVARGFFADARRRPQFWRLVFGMVWSPTAGPLDDLRAFQDALQASVRAALDAAVAREELREGPTGLRTLVLIGSISEALSNFLILGRPELSSALADELVDTVTAGWQVSRRRSRRRSPAGSLLMRRPDKSHPG